MATAPKRDVEAKPTWRELWNDMGPAWMAAGLNIGGATVTNSLLLAAATGFAYTWVLVVATFAIWMATYAAVHLTMITGRNPVDLIRTEIHPVAGWVVGAAILLVNLVFHTTQVVLGGMVLNAVFPVSQQFWGIVVVLAAAGFALLARAGVMDLVQASLKYMVYILSLSFLVSLFVVDVDWGGFFRGLFSFTLPTSKSAVLLFTAVLGSALAINVPTIQAFATKQKGWGAGKSASFRFETMVTNFFLLFVQFAVLIVVASTLFPAGIKATGAVQAALALKPIAGSFSTLLFAVGLFGAVFSTMIAQTAVNAFTFWDTIGKAETPGSNRFRIAQGALLLVALTVPLFGWNPMTYVSWGAAFNSTFMPIGIGAWWYLWNRKSLMGKFSAGTWVNIGMAVSFVIALAAAIRFWYVTLGA